MQPEATASSDDARWVRLVVALWCGLVVAVCVRGAAGRASSSLGQLWQSAGRAWLEGRALYSPADDVNLGGFRYGPPVAALLAPLGCMPRWAVEVVWRLANAAVLLTGLVWWLRAAAPHALTRRHEAALHLVVAALSVASLNNGQVNAALAGLFLMGLAAVARGRWNLAAGCMALMAWVKVYPLLPCVLLALVYPRQFAPRLAAALLFLAVLPFALQSPGYTLGQYEAWLAILRANDVGRRFVAFPVAYRDLLLLLRVWGVPVSLTAYTLTQLAGAVACAAGCLAGVRRGLAPEALLFRVFVLSTAWMLLLGPATESSTYVLCAVPLAWWMVDAHQRGPAGSRYLSACAVGLLLLCAVAVVGPGGRTVYHASGLQPLAVLLWLGSVALSAAAGRATPLNGVGVTEQRDQSILAA